ncbi:metal-dependent hydrolase [Candidatus Omnitrophota bacterium]
MISMTHMSFGILLTEFIFTSLGIEPNTTTLALSGIGSLLPDIDTPKSALGRIFPFSKVIEQKYGHRQITHSWIFIIITIILFSPFIFLMGLLKYMGLIIGITSHIMIDMTNPSGVPFFYPSPSRFVFPEHKSSRIEVNSKKEYILLAVLIFLVTVTTPLSFIGYKSLFFRISQTPNGAIEEVKKYSEDYLLKVKVKGIWTESQDTVDEEFKVLAIQDQGLIAESQDKKIYFLGCSYYSAIIINKINVILDKKIQKRVTSKTYSYCLFDSIQIPKDSIISGYIFYEGYENIKDLLWSFDEKEYKVIKIDPGKRNKLILSYCPNTFLEKLKHKSLYVSHADLTITEFKDIASVIARPEGPKQSQNQR